MNPTKPKPTRELPLKISHLSPETSGKRPGLETGFVEALRRSGQVGGGLDSGTASGDGNQSTGRNATRQAGESLEV